MTARSCLATAAPGRVASRGRLPALRIAASRRSEQTSEVTQSHRHPIPPRLLTTSRSAASARRRSPSRAGSSAGGVCLPLTPGLAEPPHHAGFQVPLFCREWCLLRNPQQPFEKEQVSKQGGSYSLGVMSRILSWLLMLVELL